MKLSNENIIYTKNDEVEYIQFRKLLEYSDIITHAFSIGKDVNFRSVRTIKNDEKEICNREKMLKDYTNLCENLGLQMRNVVKPMQSHLDKVQIVTGKVLKNEPDIYVEKYLKTDGLITQKKNIVLSTTSADCILMMFFDPETKTIANIHSGWKGTYRKIAVKTVEKMKKELGVKPENLICCMCPSIRKCHFEVREDVMELFEEKFERSIDLSKIIEKQKTEFNSSTEEKWNIDTIELNRIMLIKEGLRPDNIVDSKICTVCNSDKLHSYRVEKENFGLETAIISLK